jgi:glutathione S-transferase
MNLSSLLAPARSHRISCCAKRVCFELEQVDLRTKKTKSGADFLKVNPKGQVPVLVTDDGKTLTEGPAVVQYIADQEPEAKLAPPCGSFDRSRLQEWLNFITSELHKSLMSAGSCPDRTFPCKS